MKVHCMGMTICDMPLGPIPVDIMQKDGCTINNVSRNIGGDASNVAVALSKLGIETSISGVISSDENGEFIKNKFDELGVKTEGLISFSNSSTSTTYILIDEVGERHFIAYTPLNNQLKAEHICNDLIRNTSLVYMGSALTFEHMDHGGIKDVFKRAHEYNILTAMDACLVRKNINRDYEVNCLIETLKYTDIFIPSIEEARYIFNSNDIAKMANQAERAGVKIFGVKLGSQGSYLTDFNQEYYLGVYKPERVVDTTGAGDSYMAGFIKGYLEGKSIDKCGKMASAVAALNIQRIGSTGGIPTEYELEEYVHNNKLMIQRREYFRRD